MRAAAATTCGAGRSGAAAAAPRRAAAPRSAGPVAGRRAAAAALSRRELLGSGAAAATIITPLAAQGAGSSSAAAAPTAATAAPAAAAIEQRPLLLETDAHGVQRLALQPEGWNRWAWRGHNVNWLQAGDSGPVVLLIHGFGASVYHWRYNVPELSKTCRVYALDCLGFGWSSKPLVEYSGYGLWTQQISDFIREVIGKDAADEKVVLVGNSLGGYNALATAAAAPELVRGVVLLNAAGRFEEAPEAAAAADTPLATEEQQSLWAGLVEKVGSALKRATTFAAFVFTKQPARIRQVLGQVYVSGQNIDEELVRSIALPAQDPNAPEVFYRVITARGEPMNRLLDRLGGAMPLYLLWGDKDPWCVPARADQIQRYYPAAARTDIDSGHCPHDDTPELVNERLLQWVQALPSAPADTAARTA